MKKLFVALSLVLVCGLLVMSCQKSQDTIQGTSGSSENKSDQALKNGNSPTTITGSISGHAFRDLDCDGIRDPGEPGIDGVVITFRTGQCPGG